MMKRAECVEDLKVKSLSKLSSEFDKETPQYQKTLKNLIIQVNIILCELQTHLTASNACDPGFILLLLILLFYYNLIIDIDYDVFAFVSYRE